MFSLIHLADKYGAKAILDTIDLSSLRSAVASDPPRLFGFAMSHGQIETARDALALFQRSYVVQVTKNNYIQSVSRENYSVLSGQFNYNTKIGEESMSDGKPHFLTDVPAADLARIPFSVILELEKAEIRVLMHGTKWADEAKTVRVSHPRC
jgi:hypothetical protein